MSDTVVLKDKGTEVCCKTVYGANYVKKVTHPPSDARFEGTPSKASPNVAIFEIISETNVPVTFQQQTEKGVIKDINSSGLLFLTPSGGKVGSYVFYRTAANTWAQQSWLNAPPSNPTPKSICATLNDAYEWQTQYGRDFAASRQAYKSTTFYLNATKNNNQGVVTTAKFKPSIINSANRLAEMFNIDTSSMTSFTLSQLIECHRAAGHRNTVQQLQRATVDLNKQLQQKCRLSEIDEEGYQVLSKKSNVDANFADWEIQLFNLGTIPGGTESQPNLDQSAWMNNVLPNDATQLLNLSRKAASRLAVDGAFVVQADSDDVNLFISTPCGHVRQSDAGVTNKNGLLATFLAWFDPNASSGTGQMNYIPLLDQPILTGTQATRYSDIPWNMSDWSWTLFDGLSTSNSEAWGLPYITVKTVTGWEAQPRTKSFPALIQRLLPLPDPDALEMAAGIHLQRPDSLPASANDLGTIASTVLQFLPSAVGWLKDLFGSKPKQESAMQKAMEFVRPKSKPKRRNIKASKSTVNKIANAVEKKLEKSNPQQPVMPKVIANKNPGEQYAKPQRPPRRSNSRKPAENKKKNTTTW